MDDNNIRELKVEELENVAGGSVIWGNRRPEETKDPSSEDRQR